MNNEKLKVRVQKKLLRSVCKEENGIIVNVDDGIVILTGTVLSYFRKGHIEYIVGKIQEVRGIVNELQVNATHQKSNDIEIAKAAIHVLESDSIIPSETIKIAIENGTITLSGYVPFYYQRARAYDHVCSLYGVRGVLNSIMLAPPLLFEAKDIKKKIMREF